MSRLADAAADANRAMAVVETAADHRSQPAQDVTDAVAELTHAAAHLGRALTRIKRAVNVTARGDNPTATQALAELAGSVEQHLKAAARHADKVMLAAGNAAGDLDAFVKEANKSKATAKFVFQQPTS
jgi:hypothetical protein